jgi:hypothetical protein
MPSRAGWRPPARELEDRVAAALREMLDDQTSVLEAAQKTDSDSRQMDWVLLSLLKILSQQKSEQVRSQERLAAMNRRTAQPVL